MAPERIHTDLGVGAGERPDRPGLDQALNAVAAGDTLVVTSRERLARSLVDLHTVTEVLRERGAKLTVGETVYDPLDPAGALFFSHLTTFIQFQRALVALRGHPKGRKAGVRGGPYVRPPSLTPRQAKELNRMYHTGDYSVAVLARVFNVSEEAAQRVVDKYKATLDED